MKTKTILSFLLICILWSCKSDKVQPPVIKETEERRNSIPKPPQHLGKYYTDFNSEECKQQIDSAKNDIKNGILVYEDIVGWGIVRYDDEMEEILLEYGVGYEGAGPNCTLEQECYGYFMDSVITQNFGKGFIKSIEKRADSLFLSRWETKTYDYWDIDEKPFFKKVDAEIFIEKRVKLPKKWDPIPMQFKRQYIRADVFIDNTGRLTKWKFDELYNLKKSNEQFLEEIKKEIARILETMDEWIPGKLEDKNVSSRLGLDINLDEER